MNLKSASIAAAAGLTAALVVGVAVTEVASAWIEFSLLVGIPAGLLAGVLLAAAVAVNLRDEASDDRRRLALAAGAFSTAFLVVLVVAAAGLSVGVVISLGVAVGGGLVAGAAAYLTYSRRDAAT
ncbi:hypothetical protein [Halobaculum sp. P14]|uniref:hypothetical protein n=1 Tax=Halobaculum sp. P14 TaxID=3421638 RepID=UPI003EBB87AC